MLKKIGKAFLIVLCVFGALFLVLVGYEVYKEGLGTEEAVEETPAPEIYPYSQDSRRDWVTQEAFAHVEDASRCFSLEGSDIDAFRTAFSTCLNDLSSNDPRFAYELENVEYTSWNYEEYVQADVHFIYSDNKLAFDELPRGENKQDLLRAIQPLLDAGETDFHFLLRNPVSSEDVIRLAAELAHNTAELPVECGTYTSYLRAAEGDSEYALVDITLNPNLDSEVLRQYTETLDARLDEMTDELRASGYEGRELYLAAARAVIDSTEYDDDTRVAGYRDDLSEDQKLIRTAYGALVTGKTVCSGYTLAFKALCDRLGLPCWVINGYVGDGYHAWNAIQLDGETLYCDCTFADSLHDEGYLFMDEEKLEREEYYLTVTQLIPWAA